MMKMPIVVVVVVVVVETYNHLLYPLNVAVVDDVDHHNFQNLTYQTNVYIQ
jgi:hypothetical protein